MGNYRFRLSDMMPNAWFYKLKDMSKSRNQQKIIYHHHVSKKKPHHTSSSSSSFSSSSSSSFSSSLSSKERQQQQQQPQLSHQRKSYYFSRDLSTTAPAPPPGDERDNAETKATRNSDGKSSPSSKKRRSGARRNRVSNRLVTTTSSAVATGGCSCRETVESVWTKPDSTTPEEYPISPLDTTSSSTSSDENEALALPEFDSNNTNIPCFAPEKFDTMLSWSSSTYCRGSKVEKKDTGNEPVIAKFQEPADGKGNGIGIDTISQFNLPPIITNQQSSKTTSKKIESLTLPNAPADEEPTKIRRNCGGPATTTARRFSSGNYSSQGLKLRTNSPRIINRRRIQLQGRKSVSKSRPRRSMSESFAVVKSSNDPQRDFRDSMVEMIIENNLRASKDLEDLLACYLSLNSDEYHDLIITVFKQIWFDIIDIHPI